jgi:hypothetical protein
MLGVLDCKMTEASDPENQYFVAGLDLEGYQLRFSVE